VICYTKLFVVALTGHKFENNSCSSNSSKAAQKGRFTDNRKHGKVLREPVAHRGGGAPIFNTFAFSQTPAEAAGQLIRVQ